jgi:molybdate transport system regulatory protein
MARLTIRIDFDETRQLGHGKIKLLESIDSHGSIASAARALGMSYRRAWRLADEVNRMFAEPAISTRMGGKGGGLAALTPFGRRLVRTYRDVERDSRALTAKAIAGLERQLAPETARAGDEQGA